MKVLLLGAGGQVGRAVIRAADAHAATLVAKTHAELDLTDPRAVEACVRAVAPEWIVNAAAFTAVDLAEQHFEEAHALNGRAVGTLAAVAASVGARLLHLSTDFVFDGTSSRAYRPTDEPHPLSVYGASKRAGELEALARGHAPIVLRTSWVYAARGRNFVLTMLRLMAEREEIRVVSDQIGSPTFADGLGLAIWSLIERPTASGIYHWTDLGVASWYDFAVAIQDEALDRGLLKARRRIVPIGTEEYPTPARRPAFSVLDTRATRALIDTPCVHWRHRLAVMLDELRAA